MSSGIFSFFLERSGNCNCDREDSLSILIDIPLSFGCQKICERAPETNIFCLIPFFNSRTKKKSALDKCSDLGRIGAEISKKKLKEECKFGSEGPYKAPQANAAQFRGGK